MIEIEIGKQWQMRVQRMLQWLLLPCRLKARRLGFEGAFSAQFKNQPQQILLQLFKIAFSQ